MINEVLVRQLDVSDNYAEILELLNLTIRTYHPLTPMSYGSYTPLLLRERYCDKNAGFVALNGNSIMAFVGVDLSDETHNGTLTYGFTEPNIDILAQLVQYCYEVVKAAGGSRMSLRAYLNFGQIRNPMITLWEHLGFVSDEYAYTSTNMDLWKWEPPAELDTSNIHPAATLPMSEVYRAMSLDPLSDAELFRRQFLNSESTDAPDHVVLCLTHPQSNDIAGLAFYKVIRQYGDYNAIALGLYFNPNHAVDRTEKRRLLQTTLLSMKQLNVHRVVSRMTFKDFDVFSAMAAEGFYSVTAQVHSVNMTKVLD